MKTPKDYPIGFPYGAQDGEFYGPHGSIGLFHKGDDYYTPTGTPIVIEGVTIGLTGDSGMVSGPHLHMQAGTDENVQKVVDPRPYAFEPGVVTRTAWANQWGHHVILKVGSVYVAYAHLSEIYVKEGQVIKEKKMVDNQMLDVIFRLYLGRSPDKSAKKSYVGKLKFAQVVKAVQNSQEYKDKVASIKQSQVVSPEYLESGFRKALKAKRLVGDEVKATELGPGLYRFK